MPVTIIETPGAANANSYESLTEFKTYLGLRLHLTAAVTALLTADPNDLLPKSLIAATRGLDQILTKFKRLEILQSKKGIDKFYVVRPYWTGSVATATQALAWPRESMYDRNNNLIADTVIPQDLKDAESEFALVWLASDPTADNAVVVQGLTSLKAGPVELQFKEYIQKRVLPDVVYQTLIPSWMTNETYENVPIGRLSSTHLSRRGRC